MSRQRNVLLVEDDGDMRAAVRQSLELAYYRVTQATSYNEAVDALGAGFRGVILTDVRMPGKSGLDLLDQVRRMQSDCPVVVLTGQGDIPMAVRAMSAGAAGFLEKPCPAKQLVAQVDRASEAFALLCQNRQLLAERTLSAAVERDAHGLSLARRMEVVEKYLIEAALREQNGQVTAVAESLDLPRKTLYDKLKRHGIDPATFRTGQ